MEIAVSYPLAFVAGVVSFLSPCVLPVVPGYVTFVSGMTLDELREAGAGAARRAAAVHALLFALGFLVVFMTLGLAATAFGQAFNRSLPVLARVGGGIVLVFGLHLLGVLRLGFLSREARPHLASRPAGLLGSFAVGVTFGAGWTPCIGPVLGTILLYASLEGTALEGMVLLGTYGLGLAVPFVAAAIGFNWFVAGMGRLGGWGRPLQRLAGILLVAIGLLMITGHFASLTASLAAMGQLITLEL